MPSSSRYHECAVRPGEPILSSFWMAGFEGACHINRRLQRLDLLHSTGHLHHLEADYRALRTYGITAARDSVRWPFIEKRSGHYDFSSLVEMLRASRCSGVQVLLTLLYYGWPDFIDIYSPSFVRSFARFARHVAQVVNAEIDGPPWYVVVNEPSYMAYAIGVERTMYPFGPQGGHAVKRQLVRATFAAMEAIWDVDPRARFVHIDPLFHVVPPPDRPDMREGVERQFESQFETAYLLTGKLEPELGGAEKYLDVVGLNYYYSNQWEYPLYMQLDWRQEPPDERWVPLDYLLTEAHARYQRPLIISETGNYREGRARWIRLVEREVEISIERDIPLHGVCIFPIVDRHDWNDTSHWHGSGLWSVDPCTFARTCDDEYHHALLSSCSRRSGFVTSGPISSALWDDAGSLVPLSATSAPSASA